MSVIDRTTLGFVENDNTDETPGHRAPLVLHMSSFGEVTHQVARVSEARKAPFAWYVAFVVSLALVGFLGFCITYLFFTGVGVWNLNNPIMWAFDITNFVFWVGIGHAGTLISAILFLFRQKWRTGINRFAEAMTIFAVICAGMFPGIHVGRVWLAYWLFPIPNSMEMWPQFRSPLLWDVFAVGTYFTVSLIFWYIGLIPDISTLRDRAKGFIRQFGYGLFSLGWRGSNRHWHRYEVAYLLLAALSTPLVLSVHSVVSFDFAVSQVPGWHTTIFPPYFVAGAIFSGFAMVMTLAVPARQLFGLKDLITMRHLDNMNKIILVTGCMVGYAYSMEFFIAWYSGALYEKFAFLNRAFGQYWWAYFIMVSCNVITPQLFWFRKCRTSIPIMFVLSLVVNVGMWFERYVIIVSSLANDYLPSAWDKYAPTWVEIGTMIGSFGLFGTLFLLFCRYLPMIAVAEVKATMPQADPHWSGYAHPHAAPHAPHGGGAHAGGNPSVARSLASPHGGGAALASPAPETPQTPGDPHA